MYSGSWALKAGISRNPQTRASNEALKQKEICSKGHKCAWILVTAPLLWKAVAHKPTGPPVVSEKLLSWGYSPGLKLLQDLVIRLAPTVNLRCSATTSIPKEGPGNSVTDKTCGKVFPEQSHSEKHKNELFCSVSFLSHLLDECYPQGTPRCGPGSPTDLRSLRRARWSKTASSGGQEAMSSCCSKACSSMSISSNRICSRVSS